MLDVAQPLRARLTEGHRRVPTARARRRPDRRGPGSRPAARRRSTARNERDRNATTQLPTDQAENQVDREISANVRKAVTADDSLSTNAHNIKIVTSNGTVTLRGPVKSAREKAAIETKAKQVAGVTRVDNLLEIEANR